MKESVIEDEGFKKYLKEYKEKKDDDTDFFDVLLMFQALKIKRLKRKLLSIRNTLMKKRS